MTQRYLSFLFATFILCTSAHAVKWYVLKDALVDADVKKQAIRACGAKDRNVPSTQDEYNKALALLHELGFKSFMPLKFNSFEEMKAQWDDTLKKIVIAEELADPFETLKVSEKTRKDIIDSVIKVKNVTSQTSVTSRTLLQDNAKFLAQARTKKKPSLLEINKALNDLILVSLADEQASSEKAHIYIPDKDLLKTIFSRLELIKLD